MKTALYEAHKQANARMVAETCDALMDKLQPLWSLPMVSQLQSYTGDRDKKTTELSTLINGLAKGRRTRNHWDLASSFMLAIDAANNIPMPRAPVREVPVHLAPRPMTAEDYDKIRALDAAAERRKRRRR